MSERFIPPQEELKRELDELDPPAKCPRCGTPRQRVLRRCPKCKRRYWSLSGGSAASTDIPGHWAHDDREGT